MIAAEQGPGGRSLRLNLILWVIGPILLILSASVWLAWRNAWHQSMLIMERDLVSSARMIAEQVRFRNGHIGVVVPPAALEIFASDAHDEVAYAVYDADGVLIAGFPGLVPTTPKAVPASYDTMFRTEAMHAVTISQPVITPDGTSAVTVTVGETTGTRDALVHALWWRGVAEQGVLVMAAALSIWVGISIELGPLMRLRRRVLERGPRSLEPFDETEVQQELRPLVGALNTHMARLGSYLDRQQRFLDGAAHQMRTELAILKTKVGAARRLDGNETLAQVDHGLSAMTRVTNQLLTLGRVEHERARAIPGQADLRECLREVVADMAPRALDAGVELVLEAEAPCPVAADRLLLREMVVNLIDNAICHAGSGATATVSAGCGDGVAELVVADTGPGVAPDGRSRLIRRFAQGGTGRGGSGLGLTIVAEIATLFGGVLDLPEPPGGCGFVVRVRLPSVQGTALAKAVV